MKSALLSNINLDTLGGRLKRICEVYLPYGYDVWKQELLDNNSLFYKSNSNNCFIIIDGKELFKENKKEYKEVVNEAFVCIERAVSQLEKCRFFISDIDIEKLELRTLKKLGIEKEIEFEWYMSLRRLMMNYNNVYHFPLKSIIDEYGRGVIYSSKMWYLASNKFSAKGEKVICENINYTIKAQSQARKKCLVLDLDNTLWGGVIGEDGVDGIILSSNKEGARYKDFQQRIKEIMSLGIILTIASKNNEEDVKPVFEHSDMCLKEEDFIIKKISWKPKAESIQEIARELNIGLDAIVFIDDNPVEREQVKMALPDVCVPEFPIDTCDLAKFADEIYNTYFFTLDVLEEDRNKQKMYADNIKRENYKKEFSNIDEFYKNMQIRMEILEAKQSNVQRIYQMLSKTNQFNLTTKRYTEDEVNKMVNDSKYIVFLGRVEDRFGDNGNSILLIGKYLDKKKVAIDVLLMSCRVMGRGIEYALLDYFEKYVRRRGIEEIEAEYLTTRKNKPVERFYESAGYEVATVDENNNKSYILNLNKKKEVESKKWYVEII